MTQKTNLNVSPYYDDFDSEKNYHKVLYKPGFPVQARELTSSQSILQNQIESFGSNIFKEGSPVNAGEIAYVNQFNAVKVNNINYGIDVSVYLNNFIGKKVTGEVSGVTGILKYVAYPNTDPVDDVTVYITYLSADNNFKITPFVNGESLVCNENVVYGNTTIDSGTAFVSLLSSGATSIGSAAYIQDGIYYIRGFFVNVSKQTLVLDYYDNKPSYRVGLKISETTINAKDDNSLYDNAKGFTNYAAPGADRLKISLTLSKKLLTDNDDTDFVELMRIDKGKIKKIITKSQYDDIRDYMAQRTYDESGHYAIDPFTPSVHNSLDNRLGNNGLFFTTEKTEQRNTPSDDLMCIKISPGKAYVKGYDVEKPGTTIIDVEKPRDVGIRSDSGVNFNMGNILKVNKVSGVPKQGSIVTLYDSFLGSSPSGIGSARIYSLNLEESAYTGNSSVWELRLFDIQTNTVLTLNSSATASEIPESSYVKGRSSGASGYVVSNAGVSTEFQLNQTSGIFSKGEQIEVNGVPFPRTIGIVTAYNTQNIKSVTSSATDYPNFSANSHIERFRMPGGVDIVDITAYSPASASGVSTATAGFKPFTGIRRGSVVRYQQAGFSTETYNKVESISDDGYSIVLKAIGNNVDGVYLGALPTADTQVTMFAGGPLVRGQASLYVPLANSNISDVDLVNSELRVTKQVINQGTSSSGKLTTPMSAVRSQYPEITNATFESFDQEKYSIHYSNGSIGAIANDTFLYQDAGEQVSVTSLAINQTSAVVNTTINKRGIISKTKDYIRSQNLDVIYSKYEKSGDIAVGLGASTVPDGLKYDTRYGLRVQDQEISLNYPDVAKFIAVYESLDDTAPTFDVFEFTSSVNVTKNAVIGEKLLAEEGNAVAQVVSKPANNKLGIVYLSLDKFSSSDKVVFDESNIQTNIESITNGKYKNITNKFTLDKGQRDQYYDYSRIVRTQESAEPSRRLLVVFDYYKVPSSDQGDAFTVLSYSGSRFSNDIPNIGVSGIRATDTIDFRPSVAPYNEASSTISPFDFNSRSFSLKQYATPNEISRLGYEYYLPRIDKLSLNKFGSFVYEKGTSSINPKPPSVNSDLMEIATLKFPPYLYNTQNARMVLVDNRRYTMRDIGYIDDRVANLEEVTSLTMLELSTQSLQIQDAEGKNRFKTGFFVDAFTNRDGMFPGLSTVELNPFANEIQAPVTRNSLTPLLAPDRSIISSELDTFENYLLFDSNVQKTGKAITLAYEEVDWIDQIYATENSEVNVNPYELPSYTGTLELNPEMDMWNRTIQLEDNLTQQTGGNSVHNMNLDLSLTGNLNLSGSTDIHTENHITTTDRDIVAGTFTDTQTDSMTGTLSMSDSASDSLTISNTDTFSQNTLVSSASDTFMRSRNTEFRSSGFPDYTLCYLFLDGEKVDYIPKMLEITNTKNGTSYGSNGNFDIGEEVDGVDDDGNVLIKFRLCTPNHKSGGYNNPSEAYPYDPYSSGTILFPDSYNQSSRILNVDTRALSEEAQGLYSGYVTKGMKLIGQNSGAEAYVKDLRLITDGFGDLIGSFFIKDPNTVPAPSIRINTGSKSVRITTSDSNEQVEAGEDASVVFAQARYSANGSLQQWQNEITETVSTNTINLSATANANVTANSSFTTNHIETLTVDYVDPVAQTFVVGGQVDAPSAVNQANEDYNGAFITSVGVFFHSIDTVSESVIECQIRETTGDARPSRIKIGNSVVLRPTKLAGDGQTLINLIEADPVSASKETKFTFPEPIFLEAGKSYAVVLLAPKSVNYKVWTGIHGKNAVNAQAIPGAGSGASLQYTTQFGTGALFKSQNGALWTEDQTQDLTFKLYKARFKPSGGTVTFHNPDLDISNNYPRKLNNNSIKTLPKTGSIGITTISDTDATEVSFSYLTSMLTPGRKICGSYNSSTAVISGVGCSVTDSKQIESGSNYIVDSNVDTFAVTGNGSGLQLSISSVDGSGAITSYNIIDFRRGNGYQIGDVVGITTNTVGTEGGQGKGARFTITDIGGIDTLYLTDIQGDNNAFTGGASVPLKFFNNDNNIVSLANTTIRVNNINEAGINMGNYFKVNHFNHGMYSDVNKVSISNVESDVPSANLTSNLSKNEMNTISIGNTSDFVNFEGLDVGSVAGVANTGYVKIGTEIIGYKAVGDGFLTIADAPDGRGVDGTVASAHQDKSNVSKYEISQVSLRRINKVHNVSSVENDLDNYSIQVDRTSNGTNRNSDVNLLPQLSFSDDKFVGGDDIIATENILYDAIVPYVESFKPVGLDGGKTDITARIRTTTGTSVGGNEVSYNDNGYEQVELNKYNSLDNVRIVANKINENEYLTSLPRKKSFTLSLSLETTNENISPIISLKGGTAMEYISSRLNNPISSENYSTSEKVKSILDDPHTAVYVSQPITLSKPATSLKVLFSAYRHFSSDFRVLYSLVRVDSSEVQQAFELFPGYKNLNDIDDDGFGDVVIDPSNNDGRPDSIVSASANNQYREYQYTADNLDLFIGYTIKIVMSGTDQSKSPRIKEFRTVAVR